MGGEGKCVAFLLTLSFAQQLLCNWATWYFWNVHVCFPLHQVPRQKGSFPAERICPPGSNSFPFWVNLLDRESKIFLTELPSMQVHTFPLSTEMTIKCLEELSIRLLNGRKASFGGHWVPLNSLQISTIFHQLHVDLLSSLQGFAN